MLAISPNPPTDRFRLRIFRRARACRRSILCLLLTIAAIGGPPEARGQDRIVLRNLDIIKDRKVVSVDVNGAWLDNKRRVGWGEIERITAPSHQARADQFLKGLGPSLFRIRRRLATGDYADLAAPVAEAEPYCRNAVGPTVLMVRQAQFWSHLESGKREQALLAHLYCLDCLRRNPRWAKEIPGERMVEIDVTTGENRELQPIWFDAEAARGVYAEALRIAGAMSNPRPPAVYQYCAALALTVDDKKMTDRMWSAIPEQGRGVTWRLILQTQRELSGGNSFGPSASALSRALPECDPADRPLALYWLGRSRLSAAKPRSQAEAAGLLDLLRIPASYGTSHPELSSAALYATLQQLQASKQPEASVRVRRELLEQFPRAYFARRLNKTSAGLSSAKATDSTSTPESPDKPNAPRPSSPP